MLSLTRKTDYALVALAHLGSLEKGATASARQIAQQYQLPTALLMNILKQLAHAQVLRSTRGARGGYALAQPAQNIRMLQIMEAIEGPIYFSHCARSMGQDEPACNIEGECPIVAPMRRLHHRLQAFFESISLADLIADDVDTPLNRMIAGCELHMAVGTTTSRDPNSHDPAG